MEDVIRKFLSSPYGRKMLATAKLYGQDSIRIGKKHYPISDLEFKLKIIEAQRNS